LSQLRAKYEQLISIEKEYEKKKKEVAELKRATFGEISDKEDLARKFYSELAESHEEIKTAERKVQEEQALLEKLEEDLKKAEQDFLTVLSKIRFPLRIGAEGIEVREKEIVFLFDSAIDEGILNKISEFLGSEAISSKKVEIRTNGIAVKGCQEVTEAMEAVLNHVESRIRKAATNMLKTDSYVTELRNRDYKIQRMLYVLYKAGDKPLSRKDIEVRSKLKKGDLRGVLYVVLNRDPYLKKVEKGKYVLTDIGKRVMKRFIEKYGSPIEEEENATTPQLNKF